MTGEKLSQSHTIRYDRQLRLWGDHGQTLLHQAHVCVVGSSATATEILKSLVLPGMGEFTVIDDAKVTLDDLSHNFFVGPESLGKCRSDEVVQYLKQLNPNVRGTSLNISTLTIKDIMYQQALNNATVVVTNCLSESLNLSLKEECVMRGVPLVVCTVYGFVACINIHVDEHVIMETHHENPPPDLRLDAPFDSLATIVASTQLEKMDHQQHSHTPFLLILFKALDLWRQEKGREQKSLPKNFNEKRELKKIILGMRKPDDKGRIDEQNFQEAANSVNTAVRCSGIPKDILEILEDDASSDANLLSLAKSNNKQFSLKFWILVRALREFVKQNGVLPVKGALPDMTADSARYIQLQKVFHSKANNDANHLTLIVTNVIKHLGIDVAIDCEMVQTFCKHSAQLEVLRSRQNVRCTSDGKIEVDPQFRETVLTKLREGDTNMQWYVLLRGAQRFNILKGRYPGATLSAQELDSLELTKSIKLLAEEWKIVDMLDMIDEDKIFDMCRYGACEPHTVSAWLGGCASQEVIKLLTHQYTPMQNTLVYDANSAQCSTFSL